MIVTCPVPVGQWYPVERPAISAIASARRCQWAAGVIGPVGAAYTSNAAASASPVAASSSPLRDQVLSSPGDRSTRRRAWSCSARSSWTSGRYCWMITSRMVRRSAAVCWAAIPATVASIPA